MSSTVLVLKDVRILQTMPIHLRKLLILQNVFLLTEYLYKEFLIQFNFYTNISSFIIHCSKIEDLSISEGFSISSPIFTINVRTIDIYHFLLEHYFCLSRYM